jgi:adenosine deaminase
VQTGAVEDFASHPFKFYLDFGVRATVNTDNRLITDTTVSKELSLLCRQFSLNFSDVNNILIAGFKSAFLTFHDRAQLVRRVQKEIAEVAAKFIARVQPPAPVQAAQQKPARA